MTDSTVCRFMPIYSKRCSSYGLRPLSVDSLSTLDLLSFCKTKIEYALPYGIACSPFAREYSSIQVNKHSQSESSY